MFGGSGGKVVRARRARPIPSPYARPSPPPVTESRTPSPGSSEEGSRSWLLRGTKLIASGAGKLISSLLSPSSFSSSSSDEEEEEDDDDEDELMSEDDNEVENDDNSSQEADIENKNLLTSENRADEDLQLNMRMSEAKVTIARLIQQEIFSRDECNRLTEILRSRVAEDVGDGRAVAILGASEPDWPLIKPLTIYSSLGTGHNSLSPSASALAYYTPHLHSSAVTEARRWLEERKSVSCSKSDQNRVAFTPKPRVSPDVGEDKAGSPVEVAKSYMKALPPWASPILGRFDFESEIPSPIISPLFKGDTPYSFAGSSLHSPEVPRKSSFVDSWKTMYETAHYKSGENISLPTELELKCNETSSTPDKNHVELGRTTHESTSLPVAPIEPVDVVINSVPVIRQRGDKAIFSEEALLHSDKNQDLSGAVVQGEGSTSLGADSFSAKQINSTAPYENIPVDQDENEKVGCTSNNQPILALRAPADTNAVSSVKLTINGYTHKTSSNKGKLRSTSKEDSNPGSSSNPKIAPPAEKICKLLSEASVEVPENEETMCVAQDSLYIKDTSSNGNGRRFIDKAEKPLEKKVGGRYSTRRTRGRGK